MAEFRMPSLGADMDEGTVIEWLVKPGDTVHKGDPVAVVDTDKAAIEVETFAGGTIDEILVPVGERVQVGTPLATINGAAPTITTPTPTPAPAAAPVPAPAAAPVPAPAAAPAPPPAGAPQATPAEAPRSRRPQAAGAGRRSPSRGDRHPTGARVVDSGRPAQPDSTTRRAAEAVVGRPAGQRDVVSEPAPERIKASPYARKLARGLGVDLTVVPASGQRGLITSQDVRRFAETAPAPAPAPAPASAPASASESLVVRGAEDGVRVPARHVVQKSQRAAIARLMTRANLEIPHYHLSTTVDLGAAVAWLTRTNRELPVTERLVPAALLLKATALAAHRHPELNGFWIEDEFRPAGQVHLGVAVSLRGGGLVAPALHDAASLSVRELMTGLRDLVERARSGRLRRAEMTEATLTITNLGDQGVESVHGIIYPPQVALVGAGRIVERPWAVDGLLGVRPCLTLTLAADHRATDGFTGGRFLTTIDHLLQTPEEL